METTKEEGVDRLEAGSSYRPRYDCGLLGCYMELYCDEFDLERAGTTKQYVSRVDEQTFGS